MSKGLRHQKILNSLGLVVTHQHQGSHIHYFKRRTVGLRGAIFGVSNFLTSRGTEANI